MKMDIMCIQLGHQLIFINHYSYVYLTQVLRKAPEDEETLGHTAMVHLQLIYQIGPKASNVEEKVASMGILWGSKGIAGLCSRLVLFVPL